MSTRQEPHFKLDINTCGADSTPRRRSMSIANILAVNNNICFAFVVLSILKRQPSLRLEECFWLGQISCIFNRSQICTFGNPDISNTRQVSPRRTVNDRQCFRLREYRGGRLEWFSFDAAPTGAHDAGTSAPAQVISFWERLSALSSSDAAASSRPFIQVFLSRSAASHPAPIALRASS